jgi:hypothetical protein
VLLLTIAVNYWSWWPWLLLIMSLWLVDTRGARRLESRSGVGGGINPPDGSVRTPDPQCEGRAFLKKRHCRSVTHVLWLQMSVISTKPTAPVKHLWKNSTVIFILADTCPAGHYTGCIVWISCSFLTSTRPLFFFFPRKEVCRRMLWLT